MKPTVMFDAYGSPVLDRDAVFRVVSERQQVVNDNLLCRPAHLTLTAVPLEHRLLPLPDLFRHTKRVWSVRSSSWFSLDALHPCSVSLRDVDERGFEIAAAACRRVTARQIAMVDNALSSTIAPT